MAELLTNGGFETWAGGLPTGWEKWGEGSIAEETVDIRSGSKAVKGVANSQQCELAQVIQDVAANQRLRVSFWTHVDAASIDASAFVGERPISLFLQIWGGPKNGHFYNFSTGEWTESAEGARLFPRPVAGRYYKVATEVVAPPEEGDIVVVIGRFNAGNDLTFWIDDASVEDIETPAAATAVDWGAYQPQLHTDAGAGAFISSFGHPDYIGYYRYWGEDLLTAADAAVLAKHSVAPMISLEPKELLPSIAEIAAGEHDAYIDAQAEALATHGETVIVRPYWEFNIGYNFPDLPDPTTYVEAWQRIVDRFNAKGASNVEWLWCPNIDADRYSGHDFFPFYPGDKYVDRVGMDGYSHAFEGWATVEELFTYTYACLSGLAPGKPIIIGETAAEEEGGSKADWITTGYLTTIPQRFPHVEAVMYFDWQVEGQPDWRLSTSAEATAAFSAAVSDPIYLNDPTVVTLPATAVTPVKAILNGTVNPNGLPTDFWFELWRDDWLAAGEAYRENLIPTPSFEGGLGAWKEIDVSESAVIEAATENPYSGTRSAKMVNTASGNDDFLELFVTAAPNTTYTLSAYVDASLFSAGAIGNRGLYIRDETAAAVKVASLAAATTGYERLSVSLTTGATASSLRIRIYSPKGTVYWDGVLLERSASAGSYFPHPHQLESGQAVEAEGDTWKLATPTYVPASKEGSAGGGSEAVAVSEQVTGLERKESYTFRLHATNAEGEAFGETRSFIAWPHSRVAVTQEFPPNKLTFVARDPQSGAVMARWAKDEALPENIMSGIHLKGQMPGGKNEATGRFPRDPRVNWADIISYADVEAQGPGRELYWSGRFSKAPKTDGERMIIDGVCVGWQKALEDRKGVIGPGFIDGDLSKWDEPSTQRRKDLIDAGIRLMASTSVGHSSADPEAVMAAVINDFTNVTTVSPDSEAGEAHYNSGGVDIGKVLYEFLGDLAGGSGNAAYTNTMALGTTDTFGTLVEGTDHDAAAAANQSVEAPGPGYRFARIRDRLATSEVSGTVLKRIFAWQPKVLGNHGLTPQGTWPEIGFTAKQMLLYAIPLYAYPLEATEDSIEDDGFVIPHAWFSDPGPMSEVVRELVKYGALDWFVKTRRLFELRFPGTYGRRWQAYAGPSELKETGEDSDRLWESIMGRYQDVDGSTRTVGPPGSGAHYESELLRITDPDHPAVKAEVTREELLDLQGISTKDRAIEACASFLEEANELSRSGSATLRGCVLDDRSVARPVAQVAEGDLIRFPDAGSGGTGYRKIVDYDYDDDGKSVTVTLDAPPEHVKALLERYRAVLRPLGLA